MFDRLFQLIDRLGAYPWWQVCIELAIIWVVVFGIVQFVRGTRAAGALKAILFVLVTATLLVRILARAESFQRLTFLYENFLALLAITLVVVFQPELRRGLIRLGEAPLFRRASRGHTFVVDELVEACTYLAKAKFGAIIVLIRGTSLKGLVQDGTTINAEVSARLLQTIFFPGSALHDLAVVINGDRVQAAGVQLPLAEPEDMPDATLGSRHRAAVGLTRESDALVVVVSEESGSISLAEAGRLHRGLSGADLRAELLERLGRPLVSTDDANQSLPGEPDRSLSGRVGRIRRAVSSRSVASGGPAPSAPSAGATLRTATARSKHPTSLTPRP
ncbi:MAG: diadenylate cyclase [Phycisphaerales bacterium]|nr:diadenylate cyclase [Phycisphaerales bacterium]